MRIGYGYSKNLSDMDQELKNQYPLTSASYLHIYVFPTRSSLQQKEVG